jgi:hypothetical protein
LHQSADSTSKACAGSTSVGCGCRRSHNRTVVSPEADRKTSPCAGALQQQQQQQQDKRWCRQTRQSGRSSSTLAPVLYTTLHKKLAAGLPLFFTDTSNACLQFSCLAVQLAAAHNSSPA